MKTSAKLDALDFEAFVAELERGKRWYSEAYYAVCRFPGSVRRRGREAREFFVRGRHGWAPSDTWSLDHYLARVMAESLGYLAARNISWPGEGSEWPRPEDWEAELRQIAYTLGRYSNNWKFAREDEADSHKDAVTAIHRLAAIWGHLWD